MQVVALKQGYFGCLRAAGDVFEVQQGTKASWFVPAQSVQETAEEVSAPDEIAAEAGGKKTGKKKPASADDLA